MGCFLVNVFYPPQGSAIPGPLAKEFFSDPGVGTSIFSYLQLLLWVKQGKHTKQLAGGVVLALNLSRSATR